MFRRRKATDDVADDQPQHPHREGAKNRPTRSRKEAEAARKRPLVIDDRKAAKAAERERRAAERAAEHKGLMSGEESLLPPRDKGPVKRLVRDLVDSRHNVGEYTMFIVFIPVLLTFTNNLTAQTWSLYLLWALMLATALDTWRLSRKIKAQVIDKFGAEGLTHKPISYGVMRALQIRRLRLPKPQVKHGGKPLD